MENYKRIKESIRSRKIDCDFKKLDLAHEYAAEIFKDISRQSGAPYIDHSLAVLNEILDYNPGQDMLISALLVDATKSPKYRAQDIRLKFGDSVVSFMERLQNLRKVAYVRYSGQEVQSEKQLINLRKMFLTLAEDLRVILLKLCSRLHNMKTLFALPEFKQRRIAFETMEIFVPIAARLGAFKLKSELEDLSFNYLSPTQYAFVADQLRENEVQREEHINYSQKKLNEIFQKEGIPAEITGRCKNIYSIYNKMKRKNRTIISEITDLFALRVVLDDRVKTGDQFNFSHCYEVLGIIHRYFLPMRDRFKDYIAMPKPNGYRSLHTTVMGLSPFSDDVQTEIQIRTKEMHFEAEYGFAAHWRYEEGAKKKKEILHFPININADLFNQIDSPKKICNFTVECCEDSIFVLNKHGHVLDLPKGASVVDFAYARSSEQAQHLVEAKVNGNDISLNYFLKNGDIVELFFSPQATPSRNWLSFVKTTKAKESIIEWFEKLDGVDKNNKEIGERDFSLQKLEPERIHRSFAAASGDKYEVIVGGSRGILVRYPKCCKIDFTKEIVAYITIGRGISIHSKSCPMLKKMNAERFLDAYFVEKKAL